MYLKVGWERLGHGRRMIEFKNAREELAKAPMVWLRKQGDHVRFQECRWPQASGRATKGSCFQQPCALNSSSGGPIFNRETNRSFECGGLVFPSSGQSHSPSNS